MLYLVLAFDATDPEAPERRRTVRERHLQEMADLRDAGRLQVAGALLDDGGTMRGSMLLVDADDEPGLRARLEADVYRREGVWERIEIHPFARAV